MRKIKLPTDRIPDGIGEIGEDDRPVYDEEGYTHAPGEWRPPESRRRKPFPHHGVGRIATLSGAFSGTSRTDADNPAPPGRGPVLYIPCAFFQPAIKYFTARHVSMSEFGNEGICP